jgi:large subunit ribosomal protein L4
MTTITVNNKNGQKVEDFSVGEDLLGFKPNKQAIHDYVVMLRYNRRSWSAHTKTRGEVKGSGKKPWRQKGTGRARAGSLTSPIFRGGGITFGPRKKDVYYEMSKRVRRLAFKSAIAQRIKEQKVFIVDDLKMEKPGTKEFTQFLMSIKAEGKTLVVLKEPGKNEILSMRNIPTVTLRRTDNVNAFDIIANTNVVVTKESMNCLLGMVK